MTKMEKASKTTLHPMKSAFYTLFIWNNKEVDVNLHRQNDTTEFQRFIAIKFNFVEFLKVFFEYLKNFTGVIETKTTEKIAEKSLK